MPTLWRDQLVPRQPIVLAVVILGAVAYLAIAGCAPRAPSADNALAEAPSAEEALADVLQARRQVQQLALVAPDEDRYRRGEEHYRTALVAADVGDLRAASASAARAVRDYSAATIAALEEGPVREALARFRAAAADLSDRQRHAAQREVDELDRVLADARGSEIEISAFVDRVLEKVLILEDILGDQVVFDPGPCPTPVQPEFFELIVSEAAAGTLLTRSAIHYVAGGVLDVSFVIPVCTRVSEILVEVTGGTHEVLPDAYVHDLIEGTIYNPFYYSVLDRTVVGQQVRIDLRLHFPANRDGRTLTFQLLAESLTGSLSAEQDVVVVAVAEVTRAQTIGLSAHHLRNGFVADIYQQFGDFGRKADEDPNLIDPSYSTFTFDAMPGAAYMRNRFKVDLPLCNPRVTTSGRFHLENQNGVATVVWQPGPHGTPGPHAGVTLPLLCELGALTVPLINLAGRIYFESLAEKRVADEIQSNVDQLISELGPLAASVDTFDIVEDEVIVNLKIVNLDNIPFDNVVIEVPYGRLRLEEAARFGMAVSAGETVLITASGLADVCSGSGPPQDCRRIRTGPTGLFNWSVNVPIPSPWPCTELGTCAYFKQRHEARKKLVGFVRDEVQLPFPEQNVGALVGRFANQPGARYRLMDEPCTVTAGGMDRLAFGANDYRYAGVTEFGTGTWRVNVTWQPVATAGCPASSVFSITELMREAGLLQEVVPTPP